MGTDSEMGGSQWATECFPQHSKNSLAIPKGPGQWVPDEAIDHAVAEYVEAGVKLANVGDIAGIGIAGGHPARFGCGVTHAGQVEDCVMGCNPKSGNPIYPPHSWIPLHMNSIGSPCRTCGGLPSDPLHFNEPAEPDPLPEGQIRVRAIDDKVAGNVIRIEIDNPPTQEARDILMNILPGVLEAWLLKNKDYGDSDELKSLGARAEFVRLWNKAMKLKAGLWEGRELSGEQIPEIMGDMIAHLLLALNRG